MLHRPRTVLPPGAFAPKISIVSTYAPRRCGIARFTASLVAAMNRVAPHLATEVVRLVDSTDPELDAPPGSPVSMAFDPDCPVSVRTAARHLDRADVVVIQHEYGIYGGDDGAAVLDLVDQVHAPIVSVLHTVLTDPTPRQASILRGLADAGTVVVPSESARLALARTFGIDPADVVVIPHGSVWRPLPINPEPRRTVLTWGLLGPGKGIERGIAAVAKLRHLEPKVRYRIVGQTHPVVLRHSGHAYRDSLERLVEHHALDDHVEFVDRYLDDEELYRLVAGADIVLAPYDNSEQICSGVLAEAVAAGRPVVATRFPHAVELLGTGAGVVVAHDDITEMADALQMLLDDRRTYDEAAHVARRLGAELSWDAVAVSYTRLVSSVVDDARITA